MEKSAGFAYARSMDGYAPRVIDAELADALRTSGAVAVRGARATGRTESARRPSASELRLDSQDPRAVLARQEPATALPGDIPRLLDEWQLAPGRWNEVRHAVDDRRALGRSILTGSASPDQDPLRHSGVGRFHQVRLRTMTFTETGHSSGDVSLKDLFAMACGTAGQDDAGATDRPGALAESGADLRDVATRLVVGGWPGWLNASGSSARARIRSDIEDVVERDFPTVAGPRRVEDAGTAPVGPSAAPSFTTSRSGSPRRGSARMVSHTAIEDRGTPDAVAPSCRPLPGRRIGSTGIAHRRSDGVRVVPLTVLGP
jgi:hypothetical protein